MDKRDKKEMNRREFLKIVGVSTVASTVAMYGCASGEKSNASEASILGEVPVDKMTYGEFYQFNLSSCIRQQNSLTAQFVSFSLSNLANIFYPPQFLQ